MLAQVIGGIVYRAVTFALVHTQGPFSPHRGESVLREGNQ